ncbi:alkene reductase [Parasphingopyxis marina]|uniref:Alkene reductase n=1 Tax=Parasphingopyxis marina TaxID=2761622 RepID=A0A842HXZ7_9SPHN|nr:alkene reductase [Parasphingopyxis marina]MBC2777199.1 alkene reductase [Parasphingopyxis marina]
MAEQAATGSDETGGGLFQPFSMRGLELENRIVMSPMSRHRASPKGLHHPLATLYYRQRASAGLIISEGTQVSETAKGFPGIPGIYRPEHVETWREPIAAVHDEGGRIFIQLWHCGRIAHGSHLPEGQMPVAPSAIRAEDGMVMLDDLSFAKPDMPRALETREVEALVEDHVHAARMALAAGADGVEIHAANGYGAAQFLCDRTNQRTDRYGGSPVKRCRFVIETAEAIASAIGADKVGIRLSPVSTYQDAWDSDPTALYGVLLPALSMLDLGYVHMVEGSPGTSRDPSGFDFAGARRLFDGPWIVNNLYDRALAEAALARGDADLVAFGLPFLANPDLVRRFREHRDLNPVEKETLYGGGEKGYTDYPFFAG